MKYASKPLKNFIQHFNLTNPAGADCFMASVNFIIGGVNKMIQSEVHIVTSYPGKSGVVYLLTNTISMGELPTMFDADKESFEYVLHQNLRIEGIHHSGGKYVVFIIPEKNIPAP